MSKKYKYAGNGMGVAGLPHEISDEEAVALGVEVDALLKAAIKNGNYVSIDDMAEDGKTKPVKAKKVKEKDHG